MGAIWMSGAQFVGAIGEFVGYKLGLAVTEDDLQRALVDAGLADAWPEEVDVTYRYRSEVYEEVTRTVLVAFGDPDARSMGPSHVLDVLRAVPEPQRALAAEVMRSTLEIMGPLIHSAAPGTAMDPGSLLDEIRRRHGAAGSLIAIKFLERLNASQYVSPWARVRREEWPDLVVLSELFVSEETTASLGRFFDQRFVDYLDANFDNVDSMNWRRFEALVAEYLSRGGWQVDLGPGRNDDGVDIRAWRADSDQAGPATLLVQCKRQGRKIDKTVIKALAADVNWNEADAGLLVTTTTWSPGARTVVETRDYPVLEANRDAVRAWVRQMRTPGASTWLSQ